MDSTGNEPVTTATPLEAGASGDEPERRVHPRLDRWGTAWVNILPEGIKVLVYLLDLGVGGCSVEAEGAIPVRSGGRVEVLLSVERFTLRLAGVVRHQDENRTRAGIEFAAVNKRKAAQIERLIASLVDEEKQRLAGVEEIGG